MTRRGRLRDRVAAFLVCLAARVSGGEMAAALLHVVASAPMIRRGWVVRVERPRGAPVELPSEPVAAMLAAWGEANEARSAPVSVCDCDAINRRDISLPTDGSFVDTKPGQGVVVSVCGFGASPYEAIPPADLPTLEGADREPFADVPGEVFAHMKDGGS